MTGESFTKSWNAVTPAKAGVQTKVALDTGLRRYDKRGFSLVELSIVLVILGLLTGGILTGQNLIRAAELRAVTTEFQAFQSAVNTFRDKYFAIPGDMANATDFWGSAGGSGTIGDGCEAAAGTGTQTCNGNGNGKMNSAGADSEYGEQFTFWQHLANAGLIEGSYTGIAGAGDTDSALIGENVPASKLGNGGWTPLYNVASAIISVSDTTFFEGDYSDWPLVFGKQVPNEETNGVILTPEEAWNVDTKVDDGKPGTGNVRVFEFHTDCHDAGTSSTVPLAEIANYELTNDSVACAPVFLGL